MSNNILKINLTKKIFISFFSLLLFILFILYFIILPTIKTIKTIGDEIQAQRVDLEKKYIRGQNLKQLSENLKKIEPQLAKLDQIFINQNRELEFITTLEHVASENNIIQKINLGSLQPLSGQIYQKMPLQLSTQGNFMRQINYLATLEALNYYININSLELLSSPAQVVPIVQSQENMQDINQSNINMIISADTYWK